MKKSQYYYMLQVSSPNGSVWHTAHTFKDLTKLLKHWEELDTGAELKIIRRYGWSEVEREEYERLKEKYGGSHE